MTVEQNIEPMLFPERLKFADSLVCIECDCLVAKEEYGARVTACPSCTCTVLMPLAWVSCSAEDRAAYRRLNSPDIMRVA